MIRQAHSVEQTSETPNFSSRKISTLEGSAHHTITRGEMPSSSSAKRWIFRTVIAVGPSGSLEVLSGNTMTARACETLAIRRVSTFRGSPTIACTSSISWPFLLAAFGLAGVEAHWASLSAFAVIGAGGVGSLVAGRLADRFGRTVVTTVSLFISGTCALGIGHLYSGNPAWLVAIALLWGFSVVADSAQFSACISELCRLEYMGTALTLQTSLGFLLTLASIRLIPHLVGWIGWEWAFAVLALGPAAGIWAMITLRGLPAAVRLAAGNR